MNYIDRIAKLYERYLYKNINLLNFLILVLSIFYCYLATLPKHGDFYHLNYIAKIFANDNFDVYQAIGRENAALIPSMHPPSFYMMQGAWIKLVSYLFNYDLNMWDNTSSYPSFFPFWGMITYLIALFSFVVIVYVTLKNKWLCLLCYGTFAFMSIIIMGQTDIFCALFIFVSLLFALKSFEKKNSMGYIFLSVITLGLSMTFKFYGGLLIPIYILFFLLIFKLSMKNVYKIYGSLISLIFVFILSFLFVWIPSAKWFGNVAFSGESSWLYNLQIAPIGLPPYHTISIWLFGFLIILYDLLHNILNKPDALYNDKKYFIFYSFASIAWFFAAVYSHPQWWLLLLPPMLLVLDNFRNKLNYLFSFSILSLFLFYPMMWINNIDRVLNYYIPVFPIQGHLATILVTLIVSVLILWIIELRRELGCCSQDTIDKPSLISKWELVVPLALSFTIILSLMFLFGGISYNHISQDKADQPIGEIAGNMTAGQTFASLYPYLDGIELQLATYARMNDHEVIFHLRESPSTTTDLVTLKIDASKIGDNQWHRFKFPTIADSKDKSYYFFLESPSSKPGNAITMWYNTEDAYSGGSAFRDDRPINGDLAFRVYYKH